MRNKVPNGLAIEIKELLSAARRDPVGALDNCRDQLSDLTKGFRASRRALIAQAYAVSYEFAGDADKWQQFIDSPASIELRMPSASASPLEILRSVMLFVLKARAESTKRRARRYAKALEPFLIVRKTPKLVGKKLAKHGIERFIKDGTHARREKPELPMTDDEKAIDDYFRGEVDDSGASDHDLRELDNLDAAIEIDSAIDTDFVEAPTVEIELSDRQLEKLVSFPAGQRVRIIVEVGERSNNWTPIKVVRFKTLKTK